MPFTELEKACLANFHRRLTATWIKPSGLAALPGFTQADVDKLLHGTEAEKKALVLKWCQLIELPETNQKITEADQKIADTTAEKNALTTMKGDLEAYVANS
jgi:hypothetical protein